MGRGGKRKGAGRKPVPNKKVTVAVTLDKRDRDYLDKIGSNRSKAVQNLIKKEREEDGS